MAQRKFKFGIHEYYHLYNRGNDKKIIFKDEGDYQRFINILFLSNSTKEFNYSDMIRKNKSYSKIVNKGEPLAAIGSFVLMPNHYHILVREITKNGTSEFMHKVGTAYAKYFNQKYERTGSLFEGKFKAEEVIEDNHLKHLFAYFYMNPLKLLDKDWKSNTRFNIKTHLSFLKDYKYSSFYFLENNSEVSEMLDININQLLNLKIFPDYFNNKLDELKKYVFDWINIYIDKEKVKRNFKM